MHHKASRAAYSLLEKKINIGDTVEFGTDQIYTCVSIETTRNRKDIINWKSHCLTCGAPFKAFSGYINNGINRNCDKHKKKRKPKSVDNRSEEIKALWNKHTVNGITNKTTFIRDLKALQRTESII